MSEKKVIVKRSYKEVYQSEKGIVKLFAANHPKSAIFNEALNTARVEETGLKISKLLEVYQEGDQWALVLEYIPGKTLEELMDENPDKLEEYMDIFVDLQREIHGKTAPMLGRLKEKMENQINGLEELDATQKYELLTRLKSMPNHRKVCHGDFNPSNVIVGDDGTYTVIDWAHVTQGNASADAAMTYLLFALKDQDKADIYMKTFCKKEDIARQYVQQWLPLVAASQLDKNNELNKDFLMRWIDVMDFQ